MHGHHTMPMTRVVEKYNKQGYYTITQVAKELGIGATTIRRYEGIEFPQTEKRGRNKARLFTKEQIKLIENWRNKRWPEHPKSKYPNE